MALPRALKIDGLTWRVFCSRRRPTWVRGPCLGYCDPEGRRIWVQAAGNKEETLSSFAHEMLHAVIESRGSPLKEHWEEALVVHAERSFFSLLRDNDLSCFGDVR